MFGSILANAGYWIALTACFIAAYLWKRMQSLSSKVQDLQAQYDQEKASHQKILSKNSNWETALNAKEKELIQKKRELADLEKTQNLFVKEHTESQKNLQDQLRLAQNKLDHFKKEAEALLSQVRELDSENTLLKKTMDSNVHEKTSDLSKSVGESQEENKRLHQSNLQLQAKVKNLQTHLSEIQTQANDQIELMKRLKRKAYQSDHLYRTIRGQREMLDERLENWEKALRLISLWVLKDKGQIVREEASLGEIVSSALHCTQQGPLVCDDVEVHMPVASEPVVEGASSV